MYKFYAGVDVSLNQLNLCIIDREGKVIKRGKFSQTKQGFTQLLNTIQSLASSEEIVIGIESSGNYHVNILFFLKSHNYEVKLLNPLLVKNFIKFMTLRKTKTDKIDSKLIALFLLKHSDKVEQEESSGSFKLLARDREEIVKEMTRLKNKIKQLLFNIFKEILDEYKNSLFSKSMLEFFLEVPSARVARELGEERVGEIIKEINSRKGRNLSVKVSKLMAIVYNTISIEDEYREKVLRNHIRRYINLEEILSATTKEVVREAKNISPEQMSILTSIPGVGDVSAAIFTAEVPSFCDKFSSSEKLVAYAGIDPTIMQSGKYKGQFRISKRGSRHLRRIIWSMSAGTIRYTKMFNSYYEKKRREGMKYKKAVIATGNKLLRVICVLLERKVMFRDIYNIRMTPNYS